MDWTPFQDWLSQESLPAIAVMLFAAMVAAAMAGTMARERRERRRDAAAEGEGQEGYVVSAVLGLLALLMGFSFSLAVDRFDARRLLVLEEANALGTTYLRSQLLPEPHRARMSRLLVSYTENRIALARARPGRNAELIARNDALVLDIWAASSAAFDSIKGLDFSTTYLDSVNAVIDLDTSRKAARIARVPPEVFAVLFIYLIVTAGVMGYVLKGRRGRTSALFLLVLLTLSLMLVLDIDRPGGGGIFESQWPMESLRQSLMAAPAVSFDRWRGPEVQ